MRSSLKALFLGLALAIGVAAGAGVTAVLGTDGYVVTPITNPATTPAITGGTINGATIGATTPAGATFTSVTTATTTFTARATLADGSLTAPSLTFSSDTTLGMRFINGGIQFVQGGAGIGLLTPTGFNAMPLGVDNPNFGAFSVLRIPTPVTPASASASCTTGTIQWDTSYVYVCTATDTWKRSAIATW